MEYSKKDIKQLKKYKVIAQLAIITRKKKKKKITNEDSMKIHVLEEEIKKIDKIIEEWKNQNEES